MNTGAITMHDGVPLHPNVYAQAHDAVIVVGSDESITHWSEAAERTYGWDSEEVIGVTISEVIPVLQYLDRGMSLEQSLVIIARDGTWRGTVVQPHRDGRLLTIDSTVRLVQHHEIGGCAMIGVNRDITERSRRLAHQHIRTSSDSQSHHTAVVDTVVWQLTGDHDFDLISVSDGIVGELVGLGAHERGMRASALYAQRPQLLGGMLRAHMYQQSTSHQAWIIHESGEQRLVGFSFAPVPPDYILCTISDHTRRHQPENKHGSRSQIS